MTLIDTHAHLDQVENLDEALTAAAQAGVEHIVAVSMDLESCRKSLIIKQQSTQPKIHLGMGVHPEMANVNELDDCLQFIREHRGELTAIGEIGLDFWYKWVRKDKEKKDAQRLVFRKHLELAKEFNLPAVIHARGTWRECLETAKETGIEKAVFHWYSGPLDVLEDILTAGYYVSASPSLANSPQAREAINQAPIEQTLIETDCPVYYRNKETGDGFQAQPKDVLRTLKIYCALKNLEEEKAADILNNNAHKLFSLQIE